MLGWGLGVGAADGEANELNILAVAIHAKQIKTQKKNMKIPA